MKNEFSRKTLLLYLIATAFLIPIAIPATAVFATTCTPAGSTGLTAYMVVTHSHQTISKTTINATGCDLGIYVSPGLSYVTITSVTVSGANQHGIFVQDDSHITITHDLVTGNGVAGIACPPAGAPPPGCIPEDKGIQLVGTRDSIVSHNVVSNNTSDGGIGVADDGPQNPGAPLGTAGGTFMALNDIVSYNSITDNTKGCGIVIAAYNPGVGVRNVTARGNTIVGQAPGTPIVAATGPYIGQIVVATDAPSVTISNVKVIDNTLNGAFLPGIVLHANVFGDKILNTRIVGNLIAQTGYYPGPPNATSNTPNVYQGTTGISIVAENTATTSPQAVISHTLVSSNTVLGDNNGVWLCFTKHTTISNEDGNPANAKVTCVSGGS
ncbi:MAG TPA: right-handed parallel beta-helix repeat-containing protein [Nitrososphaerales archaeon]|nr:right-handed parallel beta-helix repeat-containing protein [Nitrososphaerales archaeon]